MIKEGKVYRIKDIPQNVPCENCEVCLRMRLMEMGLMPGEKIMFKKFHNDMWLLNVLSESGHEINKIALRSDEFERIIMEEIDCFIDI